MTDGAAHEVAEQAGGPVEPPLLGQHRLADEPQRLVTVAAWAPDGPRRTARATI